MPIMSLHQVIIELAEEGLAGWGSRSEMPPGDTIYLVESQAGGARAFTLRTARVPAYTLNPAETEQLLSLLDRIAVPARWHPQVGFDGLTSELTLRAPMSGMTFCWWGEAPPEWQNIGAIFDFVTDVAKRCAG
jgi:hypothetical protein